MAPSHPETGAMVYLADFESCRGIRGTVGFVQTVFHLPTPTDAASKLSLETAFSHASNSCRSGDTHLKSFPSEKMKRGHYV
jgi:hypothetical protein